jgi:hypothetical protein
MGDGGRMSVPHPAFPYELSTISYNYTFIVSSHGRPYRSTPYIGLDVAKAP